MTEMFCDDPTYVYATLIVIEVILVCVWFMRKDIVSGLLLLIPVIAGGAVWTIDYAVKTDRELIAEASYHIARQLGKGNPRPIFDILDDEYFGYGDSKAAAEDMARSQIKKHNITGCKLSGMKVSVDGMTAEQDVTSALTWGEKGGKSFLKWHVYWVKRPEGWKVKKVDPPKQTVPGFGG